MLQVIGNPYRTDVLNTTDKQNIIKPKHIQVHLVFQPHKSDTQKPKELEFSQRSDQHYLDNKS